MLVLSGQRTMAIKKIRTLNPCGKGPYLSMCRKQPNRMVTTAFLAAINCHTAADFCLKPLTGGGGSVFPFGDAAKGSRDSPWPEQFCQRYGCETDNQQQHDCRIEYDRNQYRQPRARSRQRRTNEISRHVAQISCCFKLRESWYSSYLTFSILA